MQTRTPAVAGTFYPSDPRLLHSTIHNCMQHQHGPQKPKEHNATGVICPHAGYEYSGPVACHSFDAICSKRPDLFILVGPNHSGLGCSIASVTDCTWQTPLGFVEVDSEASEELCQISDTEVDFASHYTEHSLEVQVPMLQEFFSHEFKILPILMTNQDKETSISLGRAIADLARTRNAIVIGSSDLTHYETHEFAYEQDHSLIDEILNLDTDGFYDVLESKHVTACGYGAIAATMTACSLLGSSSGTLLKYATSGDMSGDMTSVVGYGSIVFC